MCDFILHHHTRENIGNIVNNALEFSLKTNSSLDRSYKGNQLKTEPDRYRLLKELVKKHDKIIPSGSNLSYFLAASDRGLNNPLKHFNRILSFNSQEKSIEVEQE